MASSFKQLLDGFLKLIGRIKNGSHLLDGSTDDGALNQLKGKPAGPSVTDVSGCRTGRQDPGFHRYQAQKASKRVKNLYIW